MGCARIASLLVLISVCQHGLGLGYQGRLSSECVRPNTWQQISTRDKWARQSARIAVEKLIGVLRPFKLTSAEGAEWNSLYQRYRFYRVCFITRPRLRSCKAIVHWTPGRPKGIHIDFRDYSKCD